MGKVAAHVKVAGLASAAEALWYDTSRWPSYVDGLEHVARVEAGWPAVGGPRAVGLVPRRPRPRDRSGCARYEARTGQTADVEDEQIRGTQRVSFTPAEDGVTVALELEYELKEGRAGHVARGPRLRAPRAEGVARAHIAPLRACELAADREPAL